MRETPKDIMNDFQSINAREIGNGVLETLNGLYNPFHDFKVWNEVSNPR